MEPGIFLQLKRFVEAIVKLEITYETICKKNVEIHLLECVFFNARNLDAKDVSSRFVSPERGQTAVTSLLDLPGLLCCLFESFLRYSWRL